MTLVKLSNSLDLFPLLYSGDKSELCFVGYLEKLNAVMFVISAVARIFYCTQEIVICERNVGRQWRAKSVLGVVRKGRFGGHHSPFVVCGSYSVASVVLINVDQAATMYMAHSFNPGFLRLKVPRG